MTPKEIEDQAIQRALVEMYGDNVAVIPSTMEQIRQLFRHFAADLNLEADA